MASEEERLAGLRRTLHSLATRVPKIILTLVDSTFPVLKERAALNYDLCYKHLYHYVSPCQNCLDISCSVR
jgi:hypothetical protein